MSQKANIMRLTNQLLRALDNCWDADLVENVVVNVSCNVEFTDEEIEEAEEE